MCFISYIYCTILWEFTQYILHDQINPNMLRNWKQEFLKNASSVFSQKESKAAKRAEQKKEAALEKEKTKMLKKIGQLTLERDFLQDCFRACDLPIPEYDKSEE